MARLIRTEKEVEGRYTEQWVVVEGDDEGVGGAGDPLGEKAQDVELTGARSLRADGGGNRAHERDREWAQRPAG